jgi:hypothetical protein
MEGEADGQVVDTTQVLDAEGGFGMLGCDAEVDVGGYVTMEPPLMPSTGCL